MKECLFLFVFLCLAVNIYAQQNPTVDYGLPVLNVIKEVTLAPSYSCRSADDFRKSYAETALFISEYSRKTGNPDLLFNGACNSDDFFEAATAGNDMALIADLGENVAIESLSAHKTFNLQNIAQFDAYTKFSQNVKVQQNHTYAVLLTKSDLRGLFVFSVGNYEKNKKVTLKYAVKLYEIFPNSVCFADFN